MLRLRQVPVLLALIPGLAWSAPAGPARSFMERPDVPHVRFVTWNIGANSVFADPGPRGYMNADFGRPARFRRVMRAIDADIVCLQEVFPPRDAAEVARMLDEILPLEGGRRWHAYAHPDIVIASRFPLSMPAGRTEDWGGGMPRSHAMSLVHLPASLGDTVLYVIGAHLQSRHAPKDIAAREEQADAIAAWVHDLRTPGGEVDLRRRTPIVLLGDWNAYKTDPARHMTTLRTGRIAHRSRFGRGGPPDWDGTSLREARPVHNRSGRATHTFGDGSSWQYPPSALDRVLFTDSVLEVVGGFVLDTTKMSTADLAECGLTGDDVLLNATTRTYDHLPVVVDLAIRKARRR